MLFKALQTNNLIPTNNYSVDARKIIKTSKQTTLNCETKLTQSYTDRHLTNVFTLWPFLTTYDQSILTLRGSSVSRI